MKAELLLDQPMEPMALGVDTTSFKPYFKDSRFVMAPKGTILEGPNVWKLCRIGSCKPADDECSKKVNLTDKQILAKLNRYKKAERGQLTGDPKYDAPKSAFVPAVKN